jgi:nitrate reductase gamma subunit
VLIGAAFLVARRTLVPRVRATTSVVDYAVLILLAIVVLLGIYLTLGVQELGGGYNYRVTVSPWFRSLFTGNVDVSAIAAAPIMYQVHVTAAWFFFGLWPFSRLVHAFSYPLWYLWRPYVVYRKAKAVRPTEPGTGRRRWRRIAARY